MIPPSLLKKVAQAITPSLAEKKAEAEMVRGLLKRIHSEKGSHVDAVLAGSMARDTHVKGDRDIDIFVFYPPSLSREKFEKAGLKLGHTIFGKSFHEEAYSEHPYVRGVIHGFNVEIVPTYKVNHASEKLSAVDRTPFHAEYVKKHLSEKQCTDVRLLKQFFKGIQTYGADVKMQGVPGFLVELLILHYGSFSKTLEGMSSWKDGTLVDVQKHHSSAHFPTPPFLLVVDPTDASRNVAAALSYNQFARMIAASRAFLKKPSEKFFFAHVEKPLPLSRVRSLLQNEDILGVHFPYPAGVLSDVMWGQLPRWGKKLVHALEQHDFCIRRMFVWTDEKKSCVILVDVENPLLQSSRVKLGPRVTDEVSSARFLHAHPRPLSGPRIEEGRLVVVEKRPVFHVEDALEVEWKKIASAEKDKRFLAKGKPFSEKEVLALAKKNPEFHRALGVFVQGKEFFW